MEVNKVLSDQKLSDDEKTFKIRLYDYLRQFAVSINQAANLQLWQFVAVTSAYSSGDNDHVILVSPAGAMAVTLPAASSMRNKKITVKRANNTTHIITVSSTSGLIDTAASVTLTTAYQYRTFFSDGAAYWEMN
jgi:hypothetical protein